MFQLVGPFRIVAHQRIAADSPRGLLRGSVFQHLLNHYGQFNLIIQLVAAGRIQNDIAAGSNGGRRFQENSRLLHGIPVKLLRMVRITLSQAHQLGRRTGQRGINHPFRVDSFGGGTIQKRGNALHFLSAGPRFPANAGIHLGKHGIRRQVFSAAFAPQSHDALRPVIQVKSDLHPSILQSSSF